MLSASLPILKAALIGRSLGHSISPALHQALFPLLREHSSGEFTSIEYDLIECATAPDMFASVADKRRTGYIGANITYPYKHVAAEAMARPSKLVRKIRSGNTLYFSTLIQADSTDGAGFLSALRRRTTEQFAGFDLIILGAGGAARAVLWQLRELPFASITVAARDSDKAQKAAATVANTHSTTIESLQRSKNPALVLQATPVGQENSDNIVPDFVWRKEDVAIDLVYRPIQTSFLSAAKSAGATTIDGLGMLIEQAALSQMIWLTGSMPAHSPLTDRQFHAVWDELAPQLR